MRFVALGLLLVLASCPGKPSQNGQGPNGRQPETPAISVTLLRTDLGLADAALVRDADAALAELERDGEINYTPIGELPTALQSEGGTGDVGLPGVKGVGSAKAAGAMSLAEAEQVAKGLSSADVLILSGPLAYMASKQVIEKGAAKFGRIILLDGEGPKLEEADQQKLHTIQYDVREAAYLLGVAASVSSRSQSFVAFTSDQDPNADEFLTALEKGIHNRMRGGNIYHERLSPDAEGVVSPQEFKGALVPLLQGIQTDHYIVSAGRATPSIMYALSSNPTNGYALGGYGDFRQVRPARIVCCVVKRPSAVLKEWFAGISGVEELDSVLKSTKDKKYSIREGAVETTDLKAYASFNADAEDIAKAVKQVREEILSGDLIIDE